MTIWGNVLLYVVFYVCILLVHRRWGIISDDELRLSHVDDISFGEAFLDLWFNQYGKMISDGLALFFIRIPFTLWKVIDSFVYCIIVELISYLSGRRRIVDKAAICVLVLLFPFRWLDSAGFISTSTNYIYTFLGFLMACIPLQRIMSGNNLRVRDIVIGLIGGLAACNQEQSGVSLIFFSVVVAVVSFVDKNKKGTVSAGVFTAAYIAEFLLFFLNPGHMNRLHSTAEMDKYLPEYADWSLPYKIFRGTTATYANLLFNRCTLFMLVCVLVCVLGIVRKKYICVVPAITALFIDAIDVVEFVGYFDGHFGTPDAFLPATRPRFIVFAVTCLIMTVSLLISFWQLLEGKIRIFVLALTCMGMGSRIMMGLSATIYASNYRTFTFLLFCMIMICLVLMKEIMSLLKDDRMDWLVALLPAAMVLVR